VIPDGEKVIYIFGEGKTDIGQGDMVEPPTKGVVPILTHALCGRPPRMFVKREPVAFLQGKGLWQKVRFAKRKAQAGRAAAAVFVKDSEAAAPRWNKIHEQVAKGRNAVLPDFPMAIGVAQPCIESWLLADAEAVRQGLNLSHQPTLPDRPEELPPPNTDRQHNPKTILASIGQSRRQELSAAEKDGIAGKMTDFNLARERCPTSFAPFADEVETHIRPLFQAAAALTPGPSPASGRGE
jgi:hypothetical protein